MVREIARVRAAIGDWIDDPYPKLNPLDIVLAFGDRGYIGEVQVRMTHTAPDPMAPQFRATYREIARIDLRIFAETSQRGYGGHPEHAVSRTIEECHSALIGHVRTRYLATRPPDPFSIDADSAEGRAILDAFRADEARRRERNRTVIDPSAPR